MPNVLEADVTTVLQSWLTGNLAGVRVGTETPANLADVLPFLQHFRIGGGDDGYALDAPTVALHAFAASSPAANTLLYQAGTALRAMRGVVIAGAVVTRVAKIGGPSWAPYTNPAIRHSVSLYQIRIKTA